MFLSDFHLQKAKYLHLRLDTLDTISTYIQLSTRGELAVNHFA